MSDSVIQGLFGLVGIVLTWWLTARGVRGYRQRNTELDDLREDLQHARDDLDRMRTDRNLIYERARMSEAEREAAYELLRGVNIGVPHFKLPEK